MSAEATNDVALKLYQMEYEQCLSAYQDLYNSVWRIFSYMSALAAALVVFAREFLTPSGTVLVATVPLVLWIFCIYLPMDRYGILRSKRLAEIEEKLSGKYEVELKPFRRIEEARGEKHIWPWGKRWRVRYGVYLLAVVLLGIFVVSSPIAWKTGLFRMPQGPQRFEGRIELTAPLPCESQSAPPQNK